MTINTLRLGVVATALLSLGLAGCSSDSSSSSSSGDSVPEKTEVSVSGVAAKGVLRNARVELCIDSDCSSVLAETTTNASGEYSFAASVESPTFYTVRVRSTPDTRMVCDAAACGDVDFGGEVAVGANFMMRSVAQLDSSSTSVESHVTPASELLLTAALTSGGRLDEATLMAARQTLHRSLGLPASVDPIRTRPVDLTSADAVSTASEESLQLSLISAVFGAEENPGQAIADFARRAVEGTLSPGDLENVKNRINNIVQTADHEQLHQVRSGLDTNLDEQLARCADEICDTSPEQTALTDVQKTNLEYVKGLVQSVRDMGNEVIRIGQAAETSQDGSIFEQVDVIEGVLDHRLEVAADVLSNVISFLAQQIVDDLMGKEPVAHLDENVHGSLGGETEIIYDEKSVSVSGLEFTTQSDEVMTLSVALTYPDLSLLVEEEGLQDIHFAIAANASLGEQNTLTLSIEEGTELRLKTSRGLNFAMFEGEEFPDFQGELESFTLNGKAGIYVGDDHSFSGELNLEAVRSEREVAFNQENYETALLGLVPRELHLKGEFTGANNGKLEASARVQLLNASEFAFYPKETNEEGGWANLIFDAEINSARLSANLPELKLTIKVRRTGFETGWSELVASWNTVSDGDQMLKLRVDADDSRPTSDLFYLSDGQGTEMQITEGRGPEVARIMRDGTVYARITEERGALFVNYLDGGSEEVEFESLF